MRGLLFVAAVLFASTDVRAQDEMPILGYLGVPPEETSADRYLELRECGFNACLTMFDNCEQVVQALEVADSIGIMLIPRCRDFFSDPGSCIPKVDGYNSLLAYFIQDEPYRKDFPSINDRAGSIRNAGGTKPFYVNIHPYYDNKLYTDMGYANYSEYLESYVEMVNPPFISFDFYPFVYGEKIRPTWYETIQLIRDESIRAGRPFWAFALCTPHAIYHPQTVEQMRYQVNVDLAYGAQAIQYYTYWQQNPRIADYDYYDAPITIDGERTETYYKVQQVNKELKEVAPYFYKGKIRTVMHVADAFESAQIKSKAGAIAAVLSTSEGETCLVFVNKSLEENMIVKYKGTDYNVVPGGIVLITR